MEFDETMNHAEEHGLAWALAQAARPLLNPHARVRLYTKIGAGEQHGAIRDLLEFHARNGIELTSELDGQLRRWLAGYSGSDVEETLRCLVDHVSAQRGEQSDDDATISLARSLPAALP